MPAPKKNRLTKAIIKAMQKPSHRPELVNIWAMKAAGNFIEVASDLKEYALHDNLMREEIIYAAINMVDWDEVGVMLGHKPKSEVK